MQGNLVWHQVKKEQIIKRRIWLFSATLIISWSPLILFHTVRFFQLGLEKDLCNNLYKLTSIGPYLRYFCQKYIFQNKNVIFSSVLNPFLYSLVGKEFRRDFLKIIEEIRKGNIRWIFRYSKRQSEEITMTDGTNNSLPQDFFQKICNNLHDGHQRVKFRRLFFERILSPMERRHFVGQGLSYVTLLLKLVIPILLLFR